MNYDTKLSDEIITRNYQEKLLQEIITRNYYKILLQEIITRNYYKKLLQEIITRNYYKKLLQEIITRNYYKKLLSSILWHESVWHIEILPYLKSAPFIKLKLINKEIILGFERSFEPIPSSIRMQSGPESYCNIS